MANIEDSVRAVREHFDAFGAGEWDRLAQSPDTRVALELHRRFLPCRLLAASASNALSLGPPSTVGHLAADPGIWEEFLNWEEELAQEPGMLDGGTHILFAIERSPGGSPAS